MLYKIVLACLTKSYRGELTEFISTFHTLLSRDYVQASSNLQEILRTTILCQYLHILFISNIQVSVYVKMG
jgi:hypothetical protein